MNGHSNFSKEETVATEATAVEQDFKLLALDLVVESKTNPRRTFDPKAMEDLTASVKEMGVIVPILVRPIGGKFEVVAGARRYRASKRAGRDEIPAIIRELSDDQALEAQVIENLQREDVHPLEEAEGYQALLERKRHTVESLAAQVGKSESYIWQRLKLIELIGTAKQAFLTDQITAGHAILIARLTPDDQKEALAHCIQKVDVAEGDRDDWGHKPKIESSLIPVRALARWIDDDIHRDLGRMPWDLKDEQLVPKAGSCAACPKRTGNTPALFPDVQKDSTCTDRDCFKEKFNTWLDRQIKDLKAQKTKCIVISEEQYNWRLAAIEGRAGVKRKGEYHLPGKKRCKNLGLGYYWDGKNRGQAVEVCTAASCAVHNPKPKYHSYSSPEKPKTPAQELKEQNERARAETKAELEKKIKLEAWRQISNKVREIPRLAIAHMVAREFEDLDYDMRELQKSEFPELAGSRGKKLRQALMDMGEPELAKVAIFHLCSQDIACDEWNNGMELRDFVQALKIDMKALEKGVRGKFEAETKAKAPPKK
jgi:ParB family transcriptional regulator, chromosome partitioning protein